MKIECLVCLKETAIPNNLNAQKYDGQITCRECGSLLQVKLVKSKVEQCKIVRVGHPGVTPQSPGLPSSTRQPPDTRRPRQ
jgi:DNA-directed RNA polymerase subunit RPC12/RpoP